MKVGRKSKYLSHVQPRLEEIKHMRQDGMTEREIAAKLGVCEDTLNEYKKKYPEFSSVLKESKKVLINKLKDSLFKRALGYDVEETKTIIEESSLGIKKRIEKNKKHVEASISALIFALGNLDPENWKRKDKDELYNVEKFVKFVESIPDRKPKQIVTNDNKSGDEDENC